jgi:hypothetical protein
MMLLFWRPVLVLFLGVFLVVPCESSYTRSMESKYTPGTDQKSANMQPRGGVAKT